MTEQEQIQEEIRLLNLKVDELKAQNNQYQVVTEEIEEKKNRYEQEMVRIELEYGKLAEVEKDMLGKIDHLKKDIAGFEKQLRDVKEDVSKEGERLTLIRAENIKEDIKRDELKHALAELENKIKISQNEFAVKFNSLKGFEEQLLIREALLEKREQTLDLEKKGVKISE